MKGVIDLHLVIKVVIGISIVLLIGFYINWILAMILLIIGTLNWWGDREIESFSVVEDHLVRMDKGMTYIREGRSAAGNVLAYLDGYQVRDQVSVHGNAIVYFDGKYIIQGDSPSGFVLAHLDRKHIREGEGDDGRILATIDGRFIRDGQKRNGKVLFNIIGNADKHEKAALAVAAFCLRRYERH